MNAIKTVTITKYKYEYNGVLYDTEEQAKAAYLRDKENRSYLTFNSEGEIITDPAFAAFVYFPEEKDSDAFIEDCEEQDTAYNGINPQSTGLFMWSDWCDGYIYLTDDDIKGIITVINKLKEIKH